MPSFRATLLVFLPVILLLAACGDPLRPRAQIPVAEDSVVVWALTGTPAVLPSAVSLQSLSAARVDLGGGFDIAIDLEGDTVVVYPVRQILSPALTGSHRVGLQRVAEPFVSLLAAPRGGYLADSVMRIAPGETVVAEIQAGAICQYQISPFIYSKFVVEEIDPAMRTIRMRIVTDQNCGFRQLVPGALPTS